MTFRRPTGERTAIKELYTSGRWTVLRGREEEFIAAWDDLARWTSQQVPGAGWALLLQDEEDHSRFVSLGPWESPSAIEAWRASEGFQQRIGRIRELLEDFEPRVFRRRAGAGDGSAPND